MNGKAKMEANAEAYDKLGGLADRKSWQVRLKIWAGGKVQAWWFPWFLFSINFLDYFCLVGFVVPVLQGVAFVQLLGGEVDQSKYADAAKLVKDWGPLGGLINGVSPLPNIPLLLAATALEANRMRVILTLFLMAVGRFLKYVAIAITLRAGKAAASAAFKSGGAELEVPTLSVGAAGDDANSGLRSRPTHRAVASGPLQSEGSPRGKRSITPRAKKT